MQKSVLITISIFLKKNDKTGITMEDNFRNALIILSGVVIAAIFIHGLWTIRKQKNPYKLKVSKERVDAKALSRDFDGSGFDQDGVGQVKILKQANEPEVESEKDFEHNISLEEISHLDNRQNDEAYNELSSHDHMSEHDVNIGASSKKVTSSSVEAKAKEEIILEPPMYQQPVTQAKPATAHTKKSTERKAVTKTLTKAEIKRNQIEIDFDESLSAADKKTPYIGDDITDIPDKESSQVSKNNTVAPEAQIIILSVVMPNNHQMSGATLLPTLLTLGLKYGEMNIFHRHQDNAGNGAVTFSLANMLNPGSFDLDTMETFVTQGVSLFMTLPNAGDPFAAFDQMLAAAKHLAAEFNAQLLDDKRNVMTKQTEQHYVSKIREFDRQHRLACVE